MLVSTDRCDDARYASRSFEEKPTARGRCASGEHSAAYPRFLQFFRQQPRFSQIAPVARDRGQTPWWTLRIIGVGGAWIDRRFSTASEITAAPVPRFNNGRTVVKRLGEGTGRERGGGGGEEEGRKEKSALRGGGMRGAARYFN